MASMNSSDTATDSFMNNVVPSSRQAKVRTLLFRRRLAEKRKSFCHQDASHSVCTVKDGDREIRCVRLSGDSPVDGSDIWRHVHDAHRLEIEDGTNVLVSKLSRHVVEFLCIESFSVVWTPMKMVPGSWARYTLPRLSSLSLTRNQLRCIDNIETSCTQLQHLDLSSNLLDTIPKKFGRFMPRLTSLCLTGNSLKSLPESIGLLTTLRTFECSGNKLSKLPVSLCNLTELKILDVSGNQLTCLPDNFGNLATLEDFRASSNRLSTVPSSFARLSCLRFLIVSNNYFIEVPIELSALPALEHLSAVNNQIVTMNCVLPVIRHLLLDGNRLTTVPLGVLQCQHLEVLSLERNHLRDVPDEIRQLGELRSLNLTGNDAFSEVPSAVGDLVTLRRLTLRSTRVRTLPSAVSDLQRRRHTMIELSDGHDNDNSTDAVSSDEEKDISPLD